jgi:hypothetical protein
MLINHAGPVGAANRGLKSLSKHDKRPLHEQALSIREEKPDPRHGGKNNRDINSLMRQWTVVDHVF